MTDKAPTIGPSAPFRHLWPADRRKWGWMGTMTVNRLDRKGVRTVADLTAMSPQDIKDIKGAGPSALNEVRKVLAVHRLSLRNDVNAATEAELEARVRVLMGGGLRRVAAVRFARESWPKGEIAPGVMLEVSDG